ncbi:MAG TPA: hypothetical protein VGM41_15960, partial [Chitinophagaceae bacterium]
MRKEIRFLLVALLPLAGRGQSWTRVTDVPKTKVYCLERHNNTLYAGTSDHLYIGADNGANWTASSFPGSVYVLSATEYHHTIYIGTGYAGVLTSSDGGAHWTPLNTGAPGDPVSCFAVWKDHLYMGTLGDGFYVLDEAAGRWNPFNNGFYTNVDGNIWSLVATDTTIIATAGVNGFFYRYNPGPAAWENTDYLSMAAPGLGVQSLASDSSGSLYAAVPNSFLLFRSDDRGSHWNFDTTGLHIPSFAIENSIVLTAGSKKNYFANNFLSTGGNQVRVYERDNNAVPGTPWTATDTLSNAFFYAMVEGGSRLYSAQDSGLYYKGMGTVASTTPRRARF